jgi:hypothetical protein
LHLAIFPPKSPLFVTVFHPCLVFHDLDTFEKCWPVILKTVSLGFSNAFSLLN